MDHSHTLCNGTATDAAVTKINLLDLPLEVFEYTYPYLPPQDLLSLALVSRALYHLIFPPTFTANDKKHALRPWRRLDLGECYIAPEPLKKRPQSFSNFPPSPPPSPPLPPTTFLYTRDPLAILRKSHIYQNVRTLILDGLPTVDARLVECICAPGDSLYTVMRFSQLQVLSIRGCPRLEDNMLALTLMGAPNFPTSLRAIYYFSDPAMDRLPREHCGAQEFVTPKMKRMLNSVRQRALGGVTGGWVTTMKALQGKVTFDSNVCRGKNHYFYNEITGEYEERNSTVATTRLLDGCAGCGAWPESELHLSQERGSGYGDGDSEVVFPPAPVHSSSLAAAKSDRHLRIGQGRVATLCTECIKERQCRACAKWWCQTCVHMTKPKDTGKPSSARALARTSIVNNDCYECGYLCDECTSSSSNECENCRGLYCLLHNEGSSATQCEWCIESSSHRRGSVSAVTGRRSSIIAPTSPAARARILEVETVLTAIAALSNPAPPPPPPRVAPINHTNTTSPPTSPHLAPIPQPVVLLSSRLPPSASSSSSSSSSPLKGKGKGVEGGVTGPPASPLLKAAAGKGPAGEVHPGSGMRLRTMMGAAALSAGGPSLAGSSAAARRASAGPADSAERMRWLCRE